MKRDSGRYHSKINRALSRNWKNIERLLPQNNGTIAKMSEDFIPLPDEMDQSVEKTESNPLGVYDVSTASFAAGKMAVSMVTDAGSEVDVVEKNPVRIKYNRYLKVSRANIFLVNTNNIERFCVCI